MGTTISSGRWKIDETAFRVWRDLTVTPTVVDDTLDLYSDLQDSFDEPGRMSDKVPMSAQTPAAFTVGGTNPDFPWFISPTDAKYLQGGALQTKDWTWTDATENGIVQVPYTGADPVTADLGLQVTHADGDDGLLLGFDDVDNLLWIRPDSTATADAWDSTSGAITVDSGVMGDQSAAADTGDYVWANPNAIDVFSVQTATRAFVYQNLGKITNWPASIGLNADGEFDILLLVQANDVLIDGGFAQFYARRGAALGDWFEANLSGGVRTTIPLTGNPNLTNDGLGHYNAAWTGATGDAMVDGDVVIMDSDSEIAAVALNVTDSGATGDFDFILIRSLAQLTNATATVEGVSSWAGTITTPTELDVVTTDADITFVHANDDIDIDNGNGPRPYSITVDPQGKSWEKVYARGQFEMARGSTEQLDGINGESYRGSTIQLEYDNESGNFAEGLVVTGQSSGAVGTIVALHDDGTDGDLILRNVRGVFTDGEQILDTSTGDALVNGDPRTIPTLKFAPLGNLAGTLWQGAPGMVPVLAEIATGREQDYTLIDDDGVVQDPPNTVGVEVTGLGIDDWVSVFRLLGAGLAIDKNELTSHATLNVAGDVTFEVQEAISQEVPPTGVIVVVDDPDVEQEYWYASWTGSIFTLVTDAAWQNVNDETAGDAAGITLTDATTGDFINDGALPGMIVENTTDGSRGIIKSVDSATVITLDGVGLTGGTEDDWDINDVYQINALEKTYDGTDVVYVPFIHAKNTAGSDESTTVIQSSPIPVTVVVRQGRVILPFEQESSILTTGMSVPAIRNLDGIAT